MNERDDRQTTCSVNQVAKRLRNIVGDRTITRLAINLIDANIDSDIAMFAVIFSLRCCHARKNLPTIYHGIDRSNNNKLLINNCLAN